MTRIQFVILVAMVAIIFAIAGPKWVKQSRISRAENQALTIAKAFAQYRTDTGHECTKINDLLVNPGVSEWLGPYIDNNTIRNPWGGGYEVELKTQKIGIPNGDIAPDQYELGSPEEISYSYSEEMNLG
jgi:type II secretory pathway pseudopilin PulG